MIQNSMFNALEAPNSVEILDLLFEMANVFGEDSFSMPRDFATHASRFGNFPAFEWCRFHSNETFQGSQITKIPTNGFLAFRFLNIAIANGHLNFFESLRTLAKLDLITHQNWETIFLAAVRSMKLEVLKYFIKLAEEQHFDWREVQISILSDCLEEFRGRPSDFRFWKFLLDIGLKGDPKEISKRFNSFAHGTVFRYFSLKGVLFSKRFVNFLFDLGFEPTHMDTLSVVENLSKDGFSTYFDRFPDFLNSELFEIVVKSGRLSILKCLVEKMPNLVPDIFSTITKSLFSAFPHIKRYICETFPDITLDEEES